MGTSISTSGIRKLDVNKDLMPVADLIEFCFAQWLDHDGKRYLAHIRRTAREKHRIRWISVSGDKISYPLFGFVWQDHERVVGNLSMVPYKKDEQWVFLIANVAVHPNFRRNGIARKLTDHAFQYARSLGIHNLWLHVRPENPAAIDLYLSMGFERKFVRDNWQLDPNKIPYMIPNKIQNYLRPVTHKDWKTDEILLKKLHDEISWYFELKTGTYHPGWITKWSNFIMNRTTKSWKFVSKSKQKGFIHWDHFPWLSADPIWLAVAPGCDDELISNAILNTIQYTPPNRKISTNVPTDFYRKALETTGFNKINTLIWMETNL